MGAPSQEANRCSPSGVSQMADIKTSCGGMKTSLRMNRPQGSADSSLPVFCQERDFSSSAFLMVFLTSCTSGHRITF